VVDVDEEDPDLPEGAVLTTDDPVEVSLSPGDEAVVDFGFWQLCTISGDVFWDKDANGVFDGDDEWLSEVVVNLTGPVGEISTTTDLNGDFVFTDLPAGTYTVDVDEETLPDDELPRDWECTTDNEPWTVTVDPGEAVSQTFGYDYPSGDIQGYVFWDVNVNGVWEADEELLADVVVNLQTPTGSILSDTTGNEGDFAFLYLPVGTYVLDVDEDTLPPYNDDQPWFNTTDNEPLSVALEPDEVFNVAFGYAFTVPLGSISGIVFWDLEGDGVYDPGEDLLLAAVRVELQDEFGVMITETFTNEDGEYLFPDLEAGDYILDVDETTLPREADPEDWYCTNPPEPRPVTLEAGEDRTEDFGYRYSLPTASIYGLVFWDVDEDGVYNESVDTLFDTAQTVLLYDEDMNLLRTTLALTNVGEYRFDDLYPGVYYVDLDEDTLPPSEEGWYCTPSDSCTTEPISVTLEEGESEEVNFSYNLGEPPTFLDQPALLEPPLGKEPPDRTNPPTQPPVNQPPGQPMPPEQQERQSPSQPAPPEQREVQPPSRSASPGQLEVPSQSPPPVIRSKDKARWPRYFRMIRWRQVYAL